jgi:radical SAM protein with 4Fe4S-binding SPASM domain
MQKKRLIQKIFEALRAFFTKNICFEFECIPIHISNASYRKIINWIMVELAIVLKTKRPLGWPTFLQIEPTTKCNLKCSYCPVSQIENSSTGHMDKKMFEQVVDELADYTLLLVFWGWGEPFVNPQVYDMIAHAKKRGINVISSTNGYVFTDKKQARQLVLSGIDYLIVSTVGISQESYEHFRQGNVNKPLQGIQNIVEQKKKLNSSTPLISLTLVVTQYSEHEVRLAKEVAESLEVDMLSLKKINQCTREIDGKKNIDILPNDLKYHRLRYEKGSHTPIMVRHNPCKALWHNTTLRWNGRVNSCAFDFSGVSALGDFNKKNIKEIWHDEPYHKMRYQFREDWKSISICSKCTYAFAGGNYTDIIAESFFFKNVQQK